MSGREKAELMIDRAGVPARWAAIRREAALPNTFEIEIDRLTRGNRS